MRFSFRHYLGPGLKFHKRAKFSCARHLADEMKMLLLMLIVAPEIISREISLAQVKTKWIENHSILTVRCKLKHYVLP